jgi:hypothetical protein
MNLPPLKPTTLAAVAATIAAVAAGCGGGGGESRGTTNREARPGGSGGPAVTTSSLSKAEFAKRAQAICSRERRTTLSRLIAYEQKNGHPGEPVSATFADAVRAVLLPTIEAEMSGVAALGAPAGEEAGLEAFLDAQREAVGEVAKLQRISSRFQLERYFSDSGKLAGEYGIGDCANG